MDGHVAPQPPDRLSGRTVAVVGCGPAGLAAAQQLTRAGHTVAVFERADRIGGLLRYGIPEFKMEKSVLDRRLAQMEAEGTRFRAGVDVGADLTGKQLRDRYDAVVLAVGSTVPRDLPVPGRELGGVLQAMDYLPPSNRVSLGETVEGQVRGHGKDVVIIGGGDTGADCLGTAHPPGRALDHPAGDPAPAARGAARRGQPWPTYPMSFRVSSAHEEGGDRVYAVDTQEFLGDDEGNVARAAAGRGRAGRRAGSSRSPAPSGRSRPSWCCSPWASSGRSARAWSTSSASSSTRAATSPGTRPS